MNRTIALQSPPIATMPLGAARPSAPAGLGPGNLSGGRPLAIVHVSLERSWHGGEEQARLLAAGLRERGHKVLAIARGGVVAERLAPACDDLLPIEGSLHHPASLWRVRRWLAQQRPDVVHFHDPRALALVGLAAWKLPIAARVAARKVVFPIRSAWRYRRLADGVVAVSDAVAAVCRQAGIAQQNLYVVHDGVDPQRMAAGDRARGRAALGVPADAPLLVCIGSLTEPKGHADLLAAMPIVRARYPRVRLALVGEGKLRSQLEAQARSLDLESAVQFLGYRSDVPDLLKAADLVVMPSRQEGLCSTLLDAMFARVPIVATTAGGIPEVLGPLADEPAVARLVAPADPQALSGAICEVLSAPESAAEQIARAQRRAERLFTAETLVEGSLAVYRELISRACRV